jgi:hypothetical protein
MVNPIVLIAYLVALAVFLLMSIMAIQHTIKFGYISRSFKTLAWTFGLIAVAIILFSATLMVNLFKTTGGNIVTTEAVKNIDY